MPKWLSTAPYSWFSFAHDYVCCAITVGPIPMHVLPFRFSSSAVYFLHNNLSNADPHSFNSTQQTCVASDLAMVIGQRDVEIMVFRIACLLIL